MGVRPVLIQFNIGFFLLNHPAIGDPFMEHDRTIYGYGSIPIDTFLVGWTSINPSYFDVHQGDRVLTHPHIPLRETIQHRFCKLQMGHWFSNQRRFAMSVAKRVLIHSHLPSGYVKIAIENGHRNSGFSHWTWWFSIVFWCFLYVYQRVCITTEPWKIHCLGEKFGFFWWGFPRKAIGWTVGPKRRRRHHEEPPTGPLEIDDPSIGWGSLGVTSTVCTDDFRNVLLNAR